MIYLICLLWFSVGFSAGMGMWIVQGGPILRKDVGIALICGFFAPLAVLGFLSAFIDTRDWWDKIVWDRPKRPAKLRRNVQP